ncbi:MAG: DUF5711 family protein [Anaerostipes sp.]|jgi:hypothetical protein|nr:DUF5711 family protein [Anaerostipes sp.]
MSQKKKNNFYLYTTSNEKIQEALIRQEKKKRFRQIMGVLIVVVLVAIFFVYRYRIYREATVIKNISEISDTTSNTFSYKKGVISLNEDGISYFDANGKSIWNKSFSIKNPVFSYCGDYIAVGNKKGNEVCVLDNEGKIKEFSVSYPITDIEVASQGVVAVTLNNGDENYIEMYDMSQKKLVTIKTTSETNGYPMDIDLSEDGQNLAVSYLTIDGLKVKSRLAFYDFGEDGKEKEDRLIAGYDYMDTVISKVKYMNHSTLCAIGDNKILLYNTNQTPTKKKEIEVTKNIASVSMTDSKFLIVTDQNQKNANEKYEMKLYNTSGNEIMDSKFSGEYSHVSLGEHDILFCGNNNYFLYSLIGKKLYESNTDQRIYVMSQTGKQGKYLVTYNNKMQFLRMR